MNIRQVNAQTILTLPESIQIAKKNSIQSVVNKNNLEITQLTLRLQRSQLFPQLNITGNIPGYNSSITSVTQPDGTIKFTTVEQAYSTLGLSLNQKILATGGTFTASSNINRFDRLSGNKSFNYSTQPFVLGYTQPIFKYNEQKYNYRNAKLNYLVNTKSFAKQQEQLALDVCLSYFDLLQAQQNQQLAIKIKSNTDSLLQLATLKFEIGKISEDEFLQIKLEQLNTLAQLNQYSNNIQLNRIKFFQLLGIPIDTNLTLEYQVPYHMGTLSIDSNYISELLNEYKLNNPEFEQQKLSVFQSYADVSRAKYSRLPSLNLVAGYGSNQSAQNLTNAYQNVLTQQNVTIGVAMPLLSSGGNGANAKLVSRQFENMQLQLRMLENKALIKIMNQVRDYNYSLNQISTARIIDSIAARRYALSYSKYNLGQITFIDLSNAINQTNQSRQAYLKANASYWQLYYELRTFTLYDIHNHKRLYEN